MNHIITGDAYEALKSLKSNSVNMVLTSPPYYCLRGIEVDGQIGNGDLSEYLAYLVNVFTECKRVLVDDGTIWVNIGDSYNGSGGAGGDYNPGGMRNGQTKFKGANVKWLPKRSLIGVPWRLALALENELTLRSDIIWSKPNAMPESVSNRPTRSHEYLFMFSVSEKYFYDKYAVLERYTSKPEKRLRDKSREGYNSSYPNGHFSSGARSWYSNGGKNLRDVWSIPTQPSSVPHYSMMPSELARRCILLGTSEGMCCLECGKQYKRVVSSEVLDDGTREVTDRYEKPCNCKSDDVRPPVILDPFAGAGTTCVSAILNGRNAIGIEINEKYAEIARNRIKDAEIQRDNVFK